MWRGSAGICRVNKQLKRKWECFMQSWLVSEEAKFLNMNFGGKEGKRRYAWATLAWAGNVRSQMVPAMDTHSSAAGERERQQALILLVETQMEALVDSGKRNEASAGEFLHEDK